MTRVLAFAAIALAMQVSSVQAQGGRGGQASDSLVPKVGDMAPDFTLPWADANGPKAQPVKLSDLRGKVVVIAFYPEDRTQGCTAEMTKFRDEYKTLFGDDVVVLPISKDDLASHASWAKEMNLPFALVYDEGLKVAEKYGSKPPANPNSTATPRAIRNTFVVGKDGKIVWRQIRFQALSEAQYQTLQAEVAKAKQ